MDIKSRQNTTVLTNELEKYKSNWFKHYNLVDKLKTGELISIDMEIEKEQKVFTTFTKEYYSAIKVWYDNFEKLWFNSLHRGIEIDKKDIDYLRNKYQSTSYLSKEIKSKLNTDNDIVHWFAYFIRNIYMQPVYYYDAINLYPETLPEHEKILKRYDYISGKCGIVKDKFKSGAFNELKDIIDKIIIDNDVKKLLKGIFHFTTILIKELPYEWFIYSESPVFFDFIKELDELRQEYQSFVENVPFPTIEKEVNKVKIIKSSFELNIPDAPYVHFKKTGRTPFYYMPKAGFKDRSKYIKVKEEYEDKFIRFKQIIENIESVEERNILLNNTMDFVRRCVELTEITNYKEYFEGLENKIRKLKEPSVLKNKSESNSNWNNKSKIDNMQNELKWFKNYSNLWEHQIFNDESGKVFLNELLEGLKEYKPQTSIHLREKFKLPTNVCVLLGECIKEIYLQPVYYYEVKRKYPDDEEKQFTENLRQVRIAKQNISLCNEFNGIIESFLNRLSTGAIYLDRAKGLIKWLNNFMGILQQHKKTLEFIESPLFSHVFELLKPIIEFYYFEDDKGVWLGKMKEYNLNVEKYKSKFEITINEPQQTVVEAKKEGTQKVDGKGNAETLSDIITHVASEKIVKNIKIKYKNIRGKRLKLLLYALQKCGLIPEERFAKRFHECCSREFEWNIATYTAMNDHKYNERTEKDDVERMCTFIKAQIDTK